MFKIKAQGTLVMVEKDLLISKSAYFAALIDGPLAKALDEDGSLSIEEKDIDTFKKLIFMIRKGKKPAGDITGLEEMASFYLVDFIFPAQKLYYYRANLSNSVLSSEFSGSIHVKFIDAINKARLVNTKQHSKCFPG